MNASLFPMVISSRLSHCGLYTLRLYVYGTFVLCLVHTWPILLGSWVASPLLCGNSLCKVSSFYSTRWDYTTTAASHLVLSWSGLLPVDILLPWMTAVCCVVLDFSWHSQLLDTVVYLFVCAIVEASVPANATYFPQLSQAIMCCSFQIFWRTWAES
jgi:hypothetical protein